MREYCQETNLIFLILFVTEQERQERAFNLGLAAILGDGIYNFGELVIFNNFIFCEQT